MNSMGFSIRHLFSFPRMKLGFAENVRSDGIIAASLRPDKRFKPRCSRCSNRANGVHSHHERSVRDLPLGPIKRVWVNYHYRKSRMHHMRWLYGRGPRCCRPGWSRVTRRFARYIFELCKLMPVKHVADWLDLDWKTVKAIDKLGLQDEFGQTDYAGLRYPAVDEISYKKHHHYLTIVPILRRVELYGWARGERPRRLTRSSRRCPGLYVAASKLSLWTCGNRSCKQSRSGAHRPLSYMIRFTLLRITAGSSTKFITMRYAKPTQRNQSSTSRVPGGSC